MPITTGNLVDIVWGDKRPALRKTKVTCLGINECGEDSASKVGRLRQQLTKYGCDAIVIGQLDEIACLFPFKLNIITIIFN